MTANNPFAPAAQPAPQATAVPATPVGNPFTAGAPVATAPAAFAQPTQALAVAQPTANLPATQTAPASFAAPAASDEVTLDDDIPTSSLDKFPKMSQNEVARVAFVLFDQKNSPLFRKSDVYYVEVGGQGVYFKAPTHNPALMKACVDRFGEPRMRLGTVLLKYDTDKNGQLLPGAGYKLYAYVFSRDKFQEFKTNHLEWGLHEHDLLFTCIEPHFQKTQISVARECLYRANPALVAEIQAKARDLYDQSLTRFMGAARSDADIQMILNGQLPQQGGGRGPGQTLPGVAPVNPFAPGGAAPFAPGAGNVPGAGVGNPATTDFSHLVANATQTPQS